jgi:peroxiredoxin
VQERGDAARAREREAAEALRTWRREQRELPPASPERSGELLLRRHDELLELAAAWAGTGAAGEALIEAALLEIRVLGRAEDGLARLERLYGDLRAQPGPAPGGRLSADRAGLQYAGELLALERFAPAEVVLAAIAAGGGPEAGRARLLLERAGIRRRIQPGRPFPEFSAVDLDGRPVALGDFRGKVLLLEFRALWCGPSLAELPRLEAAYARHHEAGFEILSIALDPREAGPELRRLVAERSLPWRLVHESAGLEGPLARACAVGALPAVFLLDRGGVLRQRDPRGPALEEALAALLAEPPPAAPR